jgi:enolase-phosphatase E1
LILEPKTGILFCDFDSSYNILTKIDLRIIRMKVEAPKPEAIVLDFMSTAVKAGFIEKALYKYLRRKGRDVMSQKWEDKSFKEVVTQVRRQVRKDISERPELGIPAVAEKKADMIQQQDTLFTNMLWMMDHDMETDAHYRLKYAIYESGYASGEVLTHIYTDVSRNIPKWKEQGIKIFLFSHAWIQTQKLFMKTTNHGDMFHFIDGFYDTKALGRMDRPESYIKLMQELNLSPDQVIFLTKGINEGNAAKGAGIRSILVISHSYQLERYDPNALSTFERIRSFDELEWVQPPE